MWAVVVVHWTCSRTSCCYLPTGCWYTSDVRWPVGISFSHLFSPSPPHPDHHRERHTHQHAHAHTDQHAGKRIVWHPIQVSHLQCQGKEGKKKAERGICNTTISGVGGASGGQECKVALHININLQARQNHPCCQNKTSHPLSPVLKMSCGC